MLSHIISWDFGLKIMGIMVSFQDLKYSICITSLYHKKSYCFVSQWNLISSYRHLERKVVLTEAETEVCSSGLKVGFGS